MPNPFMTTAPVPTPSIEPRVCRVLLADGRSLLLDAEPVRGASGSWNLHTPSGPAEVADAQFWFAESELEAASAPDGRPMHACAVLPNGERLEGAVLHAALAPGAVTLEWHRDARHRAVRIGMGGLAGIEIVLRPAGVPALTSFVARRGKIDSPAGESYLDDGEGFAVLGDGTEILHPVRAKPLSGGQWQLDGAGQTRMTAPAELWLAQAAVEPPALPDVPGPGIATTIALPAGRRLRGRLSALQVDAHGIWLRWVCAGHKRTLYVAPHALASLNLQSRQVGAVVEPERKVPILRSNADVDAYISAYAAGRTAAIDAALGGSLEDWQSRTRKTATTEQAFRLAQRLGLALADMHEIHMEPPAGVAVPLQLMRRTRMVPLRAAEGVLAVLTDQPQDAHAHATMEFAAGLRVLPLLALSSAVDSAMGRQLHRVEDAELLQSLDLSAAEGERNRSDIERLASEKPIVTLVNGLIEDAVQRRASDIHIRPRAEDFEVLFRIDGAMVPIRTLAGPLLRAVVSRLKVIGGMDITERRLPQDGRISMHCGGRAVDLRLSVLPCVHGESVVIRLLNPDGALRSITEIGFSAHDEEVFRDILSRSNGMLLVTGPTGCGKSTTLYAALMEVRKQNVNIITVENPVEYRIPDVTQIQVQHDIGLDFARTLRNILRHDPDVIMVGEIRDHETAEIAVECALTGHLVLSTLHTNNAASTVTRLLDLGVESFLLKSTLLGVLAQRLARRNCEHCKQPEQVEPFVRSALGVGAEEVFQRGSGCPHCNGSGVRGRLAVYELMPITADIRRLIEPNADGDAIHHCAVQGGMVPITTHAVELARAGVISLAEAYRIRVE